MIISKKDLIKAGVGTGIWIISTIIFGFVKLKIIDKKAKKKIAFKPMSCRRHLKKFDKLNESDKKSIF